MPGDPTSPTSERGPGGWPSSPRLPPVGALQSQLLSELKSQLQARLQLKMLLLLLLCTPPPAPHRFLGSPRLLEKQLLSLGLPPAGGKGQKRLNFEETFEERQVDALHS